MTNAEIAEYQRKAKAFGETTIGRALNRFINLHARACQMDSNENASYRRLKEVWDQANAAERELRDLLEPIAFAQQPQSSN